MHYTEMHIFFIFLFSPKMMGFQKSITSLHVELEFKD